MRLFDAVTGALVLLVTACASPGDPEVVGTSSDSLSRADCPAGTNIIEGTPGNDVLVGTPGADCILGGGGNDVIDGAGGGDFIAGGPGDDQIQGGNEDDQLFGEEGADVLEGGNGIDTIDGGAGDDRLSGGNASDTLVGGDGNDIISGGNGGDVISSGAGNDVIVDDQNPDSVDPGSGTDSCGKPACEVGPAIRCASDGECGPSSRCTSGVCVFCVADSECSDSRRCTGVESCVPVTGCQPGVNEPHGTVLATCSAGVGACRATGDLVCDGAGGTLCTAEPGVPTPDSNCNAIDEDCDGRADNHYDQTFTSCGVGACMNAGLLTCQLGHEVDSCVPGTPGASEICDALDNNCNGSVDEGMPDVDADGTCEPLDPCPYHVALPPGTNRLVGRIECASRNNMTTDFRGLPSLPIRVRDFGETQTDCEGNFAIPMDGVSLEARDVNVKFWYDANVPGPDGLSTRLRVIDHILNGWGTDDFFHFGFDRTVAATVSTALTGEQVLTAPTIQLDSDLCEIWRMGTVIATDYQETVGAPVQGGTLQYMRRPGTFDTGPFTFFDYVDLHEGFIDQRPDRFARLNTLFHETGHLIRDYADGGRSHWDDDNFHFVYGRCHVGEEIREQGYAFHEGWATYWAQARHRAHASLNPTVTNYCDSEAGPRGVPLTPAHLDWVEDMIADRLLALAACVGGGDLDRGDRLLVETLQANPGTIHSIFQFQTALGCTGACCDTRPAPERCPPDYEDHGTCVGFGGHNVRYD